MSNRRNPILVVLGMGTALAITSSAFADSHGPQGGRHRGAEMMGEGMGPGAMPGGEMMAPEMMMRMMHSMMDRHHGRRHMARRSWAPAELDLEPEDVRRIVDGELAWRGLKRLKVGDVEAGDDDDTMIAEIVTPDDSLAFRLSVDRQSGEMTVVD